MTKKKLNFDQSMQQLNDIVADLENDKLPLEESLQKFEEGIKLIRECESMLKQADQKIKVLIESQNNAFELKDYEDNES
jgi:exodeoxyribonuclease VII small subunit